MATISHMPDPDSTTVKTSAYTIPVGRYAYAKPMSIMCTLNGVEVCAGESLTVVTAAGEAYKLGKVLGGLKIVSNNANASKLLTASNLINATTIDSETILNISGTNIFTAYLEDGIPVGQTLGSTVTGAIWSDIWYYITAITNTVTWTLTRMKKPEGIWVSEGTVLSGGNWIVTEYIG